MPIAVVEDSIVTWEKSQKEEREDRIERGVI